MVTMLSRVRGLKDSHYFQSWMCYYMKIIRKGAARIDWGEHISDALCAHLKEVKVTLKFYMISYLVYEAASMRQYPGLSTKGDRRLVPVWEYYDQLTIKNQGSLYRRVNDAFFAVWKCMFDKGLQKRRISDAAYNRVSHFGCVFLQFPTFTYIRIGCFSGEPFILPRFPSDKIVLMELCRQLISVHEKQSQAHKTGLKFLESIGRYSVLTNPKAKNMEEEMQWNTMRRFKARTNFDFCGIKNKLKRTYTHV